MKNYNLETKAAVDKFFEFLNIYITRLDDKLNDIKDKIEFYNKIKNFKDSKNVSSLLSLNIKDFDEDIRNSINVVKYLIDENTIDVPQFNDAITKIMSSKCISECNEKLEELENMRLELVKKQESATNILNGDFTDSLVIDLLQYSKLSEEEKVLVLCDVAYSSCAAIKEDKKIQDAIELEDILLIDDSFIAPTTILTNDESSGELSEEVVDKIDDEFRIEDILNRAKKFYEENYHFIENDSEEVKSARKAGYFWIDLLITNSEISNLSINENIGILLYYLKTLINELDNANKEYLLNRNSDNLTLLREKSSKLTEVVSLGESLVKGYSDKFEVTHEEKYASVIYLTDDDENLVFDFKRLGFNSEDKKNVLSIIKKLENSRVEDDQKGPVPVKGGVDSTHNMYVINSSNVKCSYMRLSSDIILVISFRKDDRIFEDSLKYDRRYYEKIEYLKNFANYNPSELLESETVVIDEVNESISSMDRVR